MAAAGVGEVRHGNVSFRPALHFCLEPPISRPYLREHVRGVVPADHKNGGGRIDTPAFGLGPPPRRRGERDLRTRKTWPRFRAFSARISVSRKETKMLNPDENPQARTHLVATFRVRG